MSNEKNKAEGVEEACDRMYSSKVDDKDSWFSLGYDEGFYDGAHWQRNDPAFIAEIVEKTLAMVAENAHMTYTTNPEITFDSNPSGHRTIVIDRVGIIAMHPDIVNQILNEKV